MIYLYAITRRTGRSLPGAVGLQDHTLEKVQVGELDAIISSCERVSDKPSSAALWDHEAVIEALMKKQCTLPVRYGVCLPSTLELIQFIEKEQHVLLADLERLEGCVELSVRIVDPSKKQQHSFRRVARRKDGDSINGRNYLKGRLARIKSANEEKEQLQAWSSIVHKKLLANSLEGRIQVHTHPFLMTTGAYLLHQKQLYAFQQQIGQMRALYKQYKFLCTGPWPPYSFVTPTQLETAVN